MHTRTLAQWLDRPVHTLKARWRLLTVPALATLVVHLAMVLAAQSMALGASEPGALPGPADLALIFAVSLGLVPALWVLSELVTTAGLLEVEEGRQPSFGGVFRRALQGQVLTAAFVRYLLHAVLFVVSMVTCGLGLFAWLFILMYLPLVIPAAMREGVGGVGAVKRSMQLTWWRPQGGASLGSGDRVVVAYHVLVGLTYALNSLPSLPSLVWSGLAIWSMVADGSFDPAALQSGALQSQLTPPIWLVVPVQLVTTVVGLAATFYGTQLFLDLHRDLVDAREGTDFDRALDRLEGASHGA